jgi:GBP family porin
MNKSLVALAVLGAFTSIASAQSSVTLYGRLDQAVVLQDPGSRTAASANGKNGKALTKLQEGILGGSRLGFRGVEDLGDGLKAFFQLEAGVAPDSGSAGGSTSLNSSGSSFFNRGAYVGLNHAAYGELRVGRQETLTRENAVKINDISGDSQFALTELLESSTDAVGKGSRPLFQNFGTRVDNAIRYTTPVFGGLQASAIVGLSERTKTLNSSNVTTAKAANYRGVGLVYTAGPLALDLLYEDLSKGVASSGSYNNTTTVGGSYDFGIAKLAAAYQHTNNLGSQLASTTSPLTGNDVDAWNIGVAVPVNAFTFKAQYTGSNLDRSGASSLSQNKYGASVQYAFSKRTTVYLSATERGGDQHRYFSRQSEVAAGLAHTF